MTTSRKAAQRRKNAIVAEIAQLRELLWRDAVLVGLIPYVKEHIARLQLQFDDIEHRFPSSARQGVRMHVFVAA